jgi:hypothetical protein
MAEAKRRHLLAEEREILQHLQVLSVTSGSESTRSDELIVEHHHLHDTTLVGEYLRYAATYIRNSGWRWPPGAPPPFTSRIAISSSAGVSNNAGVGAPCWPTTRRGVSVLSGQIVGPRVGSEDFGHLQPNGPGWRRGKQPRCCPEVRLSASDSRGPRQDRARP